MIGQIAPLVQGSRMRVAAVHVLGGAFGGVAAGAILGWFAVAVNELFGREWTVVRTYTMCALLILGAAVDIGALRRGLLSGTNRQTPRSWNCALGPTGALFAWGADLSLVISTRITYQGMLLVVAAALLSPNYVTALLVMFAFGTMRALAAAMYATRLRDVDETIHVLMLATGFTAAASPAFLWLSPSCYQHH